MTTHTAVSCEADDQATNAGLYEVSLDCVKVLDLEGTIVRLNPGGVHVLELDSPTQLNGAVWRGLWPAAAQASVDDAVRAARAGQPAQFSAFCPTAKGSPRWWDVVVSPIRGPGGAVTQLLAVSRDITPLVDAQEALKAADRQKDDFLALISHELRNPLSAIVAAAAVLNLPSLGADKVASTGKLIARQAGHMSRLAEDLLDFSRAARRELALQIDTVDLRKIVLDAAEQLQPSTDQKRQQVRVSLPADAVTVQADRMRLVQVVGNLLGNASRYSPDQTVIDLVLGAVNDRAVLEIRDQGKGISAEFMPRLFDLYAQVETSSARRTGGLGLGLALVKTFVDLHHGQVDAYSGGEGQGSTFTVTLPLARR